MSGESEIGPERAAQLLGEGAQAVDVREDYEWDAGHLAGSSHIELTQLASRAGELDPGRPVVVVCRSGERSRLAADALRASGYDAYNLVGGLTAWHEEGRPLEPENGTVADRRPGPLN